MPAISVRAQTLDEAEPSETVPPNVETLQKLLAEPDVQAWLRAHAIASEPKHAASEPKTEHSAPPSHRFADYIASIRNHFYGLGAAMKDLPAQFERAGQMVVEDIEESGALGLLALLMILVGACFAAKLVYRKATVKFVQQFRDASQATTREKLALRTRRYFVELGEVAATGLAGTAAFLALDYWPDIIERIILAFLLAYIGWLTIRATSRYLLRAESGFRIVPLDEQAANFWAKQINILAGLLTFGSATVLSICLLGFSDEACEVIAYALGLLILTLALYTFHAGIRVPDGERRETVRRSGSLFLSLSLIVLWCLWALGATPVFLMGLILLGTVYAIKLMSQCVDHCFGDADDSLVVMGNPKLTAVLIERTIRFGLILLALGLTVWAWDVDFVALNSVDSRIGRLVHGLILAGIILLAANFSWSMLRTLIDQQIARVRAGTVDPQQANRFATLLPVLRNFLWAAIAAFAVLMALSELGVEVAPLIAGAGVAGVAIGFGAQTLVKDIISGIFYLVDDAFRVGEYIESGSYKGTVESFSLRSVRLRHNRGPIFTVPFGVLGAVQNMSRDWVIEKLRLTITYDSDVEKARKIIKRIGLELAEDPDLKSVTIEPLKMQGVEDFGDYGVVLTLKLKTKPGQQFQVRRRAMVLIKREFEANGIKFASPSVQVTGTTTPSADQQREMVAAHAIVAAAKAVPAS
ncbi:MAG: mechanosensitive ion channel family protein [Hyphomicrobiales bacterium]